ncbi:MAG: glycosyltransferase family 4 protein [Candidatus Binatia bacterium]
MRILFLTDNFPPERNAPANRIYGHAREWVRAGERVTVVTGAPNFPDGRVYEGYRNRAYWTEDVDGIRVVRVWTYVAANRGTVRRTADYASFLLSGALGALLQDRPDVVVATSPQFLTAVAGAAVSAVRSVPWVFEVRDLWPESIRAVGAMREGRLLRALERAEFSLYRRATRVVTVTEAIRRRIACRGIPEANLEVIENGVDLGLFAPRERDDALARSLGIEGRFVVSYIGTHGMAHGLETVLEAAGVLRDNAATFLLVGSGAEKEKLVRRAREARLENIVFVDPRPRSEMPRFWSISDATVVPLRRDPLFRTTVPSKMFEAMAMGIPILLGVEGEARTILDDSGAGLAFPPEDAEALAASVRLLARDGGLRERIRRQSLAAAPRYSRNVAAARMLEVLREVAGHGTDAAENGAAARGGRVVAGGGF